MKVRGFKMENVQEKIIIFLHIPKTAGTTLFNIINNQYNIEERMVYYPIDNPNFNKFLAQLKERLNEDQNKVKVVYGHFPFGIQKQINKSFSYITMLRNPIERVLSTYYFIQRNFEHPLHSKVVDMNIKEFLTSNDELIQKNVFNVQTDFISGKYPPNLQEAKKNLDQYFDIVGITEMFAESLFFIKEEFGWDNIELKSFNVTKNRPKYEQHSKDIIELIEEKNELDFKLYQYGKKLFDKKMQSLNESEKEKMREFISEISN